MKKPWKKGYDDGFDDGVFGKNPKIIEIGTGPFSSIFEMECSRAYDKGYLEGYQDGKKENESFFGETEEGFLEKFKEGYFNGLQDRAHKKTSEVKNKKTKPSIFPCVNSKSETVYKRGYVVGYQRGE